MKTGIALAALVFTAAIAPAGQDKGAVQMDKTGPFHPGGSIAFNVKLNEPMPKGAHLDVRIAPISDEQEEVDLGGGRAVDTPQTEFRVTGTVPEGALPGDWHISVIYLLRPGSPWDATIAPNDLKFRVEGRRYPIPTKADVTLGR
jgi:hypothetical protein